MIHKLGKSNTPYSHESRNLRIFTLQTN